MVNFEQKKEDICQFMSRQELDLTNVGLFLPLSAQKRPFFSKIAKYSPCLVSFTGGGGGGAGVSFFSSTDSNKESNS